MFDVCIAVLDNPFFGTGAIAGKMEKVGLKESAGKGRELVERKPLFHTDGTIFLPTRSYEGAENVRGLIDLHV